MSTIKRSITIPQFLSIPLENQMYIQDNTEGFTGPELSIADMFEFIGDNVLELLTVDVDPENMTIASICDRLWDITKIIAEDKIKEIANKDK